MKIGGVARAVRVAQLAPVPRRAHGGRHRSVGGIEGARLVRRRRGAFLAAEQRLRREITRSAA